MSKFPSNISVNAPSVDLHTYKITKSLGATSAPLPRLDGQLRLQGTVQTQSVAAGLKGAKRARRRPPAPQVKTSKVIHEAADGWDWFHIFLGMSVILGVVLGVHNLAEFLEKLHTLNPLEESGFAASILIVARGLARSMGALVAQLIVGVFAIVRQLKA